MTELEDYKASKMIDILEQAIKWKFPKITGLNVSVNPSDSKKFNIIFNDGVYTKQEVEQYLHELQNNH